jgi:hypothetical protein
MKKGFLLLMMCALPLLGFAQSDDFGTILSVEADKKITKPLHVGFEAEMRTRDHVKAVDRWSGGVSISYKLLSWLKASAGYTLLYDNFERISYYEEGDGKVKKGIVNVGDPKKRGEYWGIRNRFHVTLTGSQKFGNLELSLRERWQYTYRPQHTVDERYSYYDEDWDGEEHTYRGKGKNILRSRFMAEYNSKSFPLTPFVSVEAFNAWNLEKVRYQAGGDWKINKKNIVTLFYRYQTVNDDSDFEPNRHSIGLSYKVKF